MVNVLFNGLVLLLQGFLNTLFGPIYTILGQLLTNVLTQDFYSNYEGILTDYIAPLVGWFIQLVPPFSFRVLLLWFTFIVGLYGIALAIHIVIKPFRVLKKLIPLA